VETRIVAPSAATGGAYCVLHQFIPAGLISPAHRHEYEDQVAYVLEGMLGFWVEGSGEVAVGAGSCVARPRGLLHALWNISPQRACILEITSPGESFERYMRELSALTRRGDADEAEVRRLAARHGITFAPRSQDPSRVHGDTQHAAFWRR
jgi:mannose-6-phosphate isomerase-like protein (cupin superfamily)